MRFSDTLAAATRPALATQMAAHIDGVQQAATDKAREHHVTAAAAVGSPRYTRLMLSVARWVHAMGWHEDGAAMDKGGRRLQEPVTKFARKILKRDQRRLRMRASDRCSRPGRCGPISRH